MRRLRCVFCGLQMPLTFCSAHAGFLVWVLLQNSQLWAQLSPPALAAAAERSTRLSVWFVPEDALISGDASFGSTLQSWADSRGCRQRQRFRSFSARRVGL